MRHAPGDLQIDNAIPDAVAPDHFAHNHAKRAQAHRLRHPKLTKRAAKTAHVAALVDETAVANLADFINAVRELKSAILDVDGRVRVRRIPAVYIHNPCHRPPLSRKPSTCNSIAKVHPAYKIARGLDQPAL